MQTIRYLFMLLFGCWAGSLIAIEAPVFAASDVPVRSIVVMGTGEMKAAPDLAIVRAGVVTQATEAKAALDENSQRLQQVFAALTTFGVSKADVQTAQLTINPQRDRNQGSESRLPKIVGYTVHHQVVLRLRQIERLGQLLDQLVTLGVNQFSDIQFAIGEPAPLLDQARTAAVVDARRKADLMSQAGETVLGHVLTIREVGTQRPQPGFTARMSLAESVPVATGTETLSVTVEVQFALESRP